MANYLKLTKNNVSQRQLDAVVKLLEAVSQVLGGASPVDFSRPRSDLVVPTRDYRLLAKAEQRLANALGNP